MANILPNGTVLPAGLLGTSALDSTVSAFNHFYKNTTIKAGFIVKSYAATDPQNRSKLCTEYDVIVIEQFENKGTTSLLYRNCLSSQGLGSIADFFEFTLRPKTFQTQKGYPTFSDQDGAIVLIQCLDGVGDKAVVIGNLIHPDRPTTITSTAPQMSGEYNGVNVQINNDGSCSLTFNGATNSKGVPTNSSQGNTVVQIKTDGTFEVNNSEVNITMDRTNKNLSMSSTGNWTVNIQGNTNITTQGQTNITSSGKCVVQASEIDLNGSLGQVLTNITDPVVDTIFGQLTMGVDTVKAGQ